jgi:hypothetical protein
MEPAAGASRSGDAVDAVHVLGQCRKRARKRQKPTPDHRQKRPLHAATSFSSLPGAPLIDAGIVMLRERNTPSNSP